MGCYPDLKGIDMGLEFIEPSSPSLLGRQIRPGIVQIVAAR